MKKTTVAIVALFAVNSALATVCQVTQGTTPPSDCPPPTIYDKGDAYTIEQIVTSKSGYKVYIYNDSNGTEVDVLNNQGDLQQAGVFNPDTSFQASMNFLAKLQQALKAGNKRAVSKMIRYPLTVDGKPTIKNPQDFIKNYDAIFGSAIIAAIAGQDPYTLFSNSQGVSITGGKVWFSGYNNHDKLGPIRVIAVNTSS
ncbi:MAG: hypothetical protein K5Q00_01410 [Gammaproteobacteria bacterium]|nr:hypothetical protein [Gammaproteobacteria bacterium]